MTTAFTPYWHQPEPTVGAVLITSQDERDDLDARDWPHGKKKAAKAEAIEAPSDKPIEPGEKSAPPAAPAARKGGRPKKA